MFDARVHAQQARKNEGFFSRIDLSASADWGATVLFYAALHYMSAYFATLQMHPARHVDRQKAIAKDAVARVVSFEYARLKTASENARYNCVAFNPSTVKGLKRVELERIKAHLAPYLP